MGKSGCPLLKGVMVALLLAAQAVAAAEARARRPLPTRWADLISQGQYERLISLVEADLRARKLTPMIAADGSLKIKEEPFASSTFGLDNLVQKCRLAAEDKWLGIVHEHFDNLVASVEEDLRLQEKLRKADHALPLLGVRLYGEDAVPADAKKDLVWRTDLEGTITVLVLDLPTSLRSVTRAQADGWGLKDAELFARALKNTKQNVPAGEVEDVLPGGGKLIAIVGDNLLASAHVLMLADHPKALGKAGALVGVPTRHIVLCHPINDQSASSAMEALVPMILNLHREGPGSTSDRLYWYHEGRFTPIPARVDPRGVTVNPPDELKTAIEKLPATSAATPPKADK
jgi:hypothetical protein